MKNILSVYKPVGKTPYEVIQQLKKQFPEYHESSITYAGRLDPLAHGVLLLLVDEAISHKENYVSLPKTYEFTALLGIETDSYDFLGLVNKSQESNSKFQITSKSQKINTQLKEKIQKFIVQSTGKQVQKYPPFSSKTVQGKPLFWWTKEGRLDEITIPTREIEIVDFQLLEIGEIDAQELAKNIDNSVSLVQGDFRQEETRARWQEFFAKNKKTQYTTARFRITCSSGTYVRGIVHELGRSLGTGAVTSEILRTQVGEFSLDDALRLAFLA